MTEFKIPDKTDCIWIEDGSWMHDPGTEDVTQAYNRLTGRDLAQDAEGTSEHGLGDCYLRILSSGYRVVCSVDGYSIYIPEQQKVPTKTGGEEMFDLEEFSRMNRERCESPQGFNHKLGSWSFSDWITAIAGELGEAANVVKKLNRVRDGIPGNKLSEADLKVLLTRELADTFIYLDLMFQRLGVNIGEVVLQVFNAKSKEIGYPVMM